MYYFQAFTLINVNFGRVKECTAQYSCVQVVFYYSENILGHDFDILYILKNATLNLNIEKVELLSINLRSN